MAERTVKRATKAAAKKERKKNVQRSGKWTVEKRTEIETKKVPKSKDPARQERKRVRLLQRHNKLKVQAARFAANASSRCMICVSFVSESSIIFEM